MLGVNENCPNIFGRFISKFGEIQEFLGEKSECIKKVFKRSSLGNLSKEVPNYSNLPKFFQIFAPSSDVARVSCAQYQKILRP